MITVQIDFGLEHEGFRVWGTKQGISLKALTQVSSKVLRTFYPPSTPQFPLTSTKKADIAIESRPILIIQQKAETAIESIGPYLNFYGRFLAQRIPETPKTP